MIAPGYFLQRILLKWDTPDTMALMFCHQAVVHLRAGIPLTQEDRDWIAMLIEGQMECWDVAPRLSDFVSGERKQIAGVLGIKAHQDLQLQATYSKAGDQLRAKFHHGYCLGLRDAEDVVQSGPDSLAAKRRHYPWRANPM